MSSDYKEVSLSRPLSEYCRNATNREGDTFVGIKSETVDGNHEITVNFPIGYQISENEESVRDEILELLTVLQEYNDKQSITPQISAEQVLKTVRFPVQAYLRVMQYYLQNGLYKELEEEYALRASGHISMKRTIGKVQPSIQESGLVFLNHMVRQKNDTDKNLISEINKYCVYESFIKLGWIYKYKLPQPPNVKNPNIKAYKIILQQKIRETNKDRIRSLFQSMLAIIDFRNSEDEPEEFYFGTNRFEYIWERLIDDTYGIANKSYYFPKTTWRLKYGAKDNATIEPDSIMLTDKHIIVLDAKYYKYGVTVIPNDLPKSTDINKQISYAEYIAENPKFENERQQGKKILNAFLMPFNKGENKFLTNENYFSIGEAVADWKQSTNDYEKVQGMLVDVKTLISNTTKPNLSEIKKLSEAILKSLEENKKNRSS